MLLGIPSPRFTRKPSSRLFPPLLWPTRTLARQSCWKDLSAGKHSYRDLYTADRTRICLWSRISPGHDRHISEIIPFPLFPPKFTWSSWSIERDAWKKCPGDLVRHGSPGDLRVIRKWMKKTFQAVEKPVSPLFIKIYIWNLYIVCSCISSWYSIHTLVNM